MNACRYHDAFLARILLLVAVRVRYGQQVNKILGQRTAQYFDPAQLALHWVVLYLFDVLLQIRVRVRVAVSEVVRVVLVGKLARPCERVQGTGVAIVVLRSNVVLVVLDVGAPASPAHILVLGI